MKFHTITEFKKKIQSYSKKRTCFLVGKNTQRLLIRKGILKKSYNIFLKEGKNPNFKEIYNIGKKLKKKKITNIVAIGGGSTLDIAKILAYADQRKYKKKIFNTSKNIKKTFNLVLCPTTAGSGAEKTNFSVLYYKNKKFSLIMKNYDYPTALYCPEIYLFNNVKYNLASSSFDCLAQLIESMFSALSSKESINYSKKGITILMKYLKTFIEKKNVRSTKKMIEATMYSGMCINIAKTNLPHSLSYWLAKSYKISHGHSVAVLFEKILFYFYQNIPKDYKKKKYYKKIFSFLFKIFKVKNIENLCIEIIKLKKYLNLKDYSKDLKNKHKLRLLKKNVNMERLKNCFIQVDHKSIDKIVYS